MSDLSEGIAKEALRPPEKFHPSKNYTFPKRTFGKQGKINDHFVLNGALLTRGCTMMLLPMQRFVISA